MRENLLIRFNQILRFIEQSKVVINVLSKYIKDWLKFYINIFITLVKPPIQIKAIFRKKNKYSSNVNLKLLHIIPTSVAHVDQRHGSSKDILNLENSLARKFNIDQLYLTRGKQAIVEILNLLRRNKIGFKSYECIVINMPGSCLLLAITLYILKSKRSKLVYRSHNAELFHILDRVDLEPGLFSRFKLRVKAINSLIQDLLSAQLFNYIFVISTYDGLTYWKKFTKASKVLHLPYAPWLFKKNGNDRSLILSLGSAVYGGSIALEQELTFYNFAREIGPLEKFTFCQIGGQRTNQAPSFVDAYNIVDNPEEFLVRTKVICLCSSRGRGTKTKLADAVANGIPVITPEQIFERTDVEFRNGIVPYGPNSKNKTFKDALFFALNHFDVPLTSNNNLADLVETKVNYTLDVLSNNFLRRAVDKEECKNDLCLVTVLYKDNPFIYWNMESCARRNINSKITWLIVLNMNETDRLFLKSKLQEFLSNFANCKLIVLMGIKNEIHETGFGAMNHALGLNYAMSYLIGNYYEYQFLCVIDPDMFVLRMDWINQLADKLNKSNKFIIGTEFDQAAITHDSEKFSPHFMFFKSDITFFSHFDFTPDFLRAEKIKNSFKNYTTISPKINLKSVTTLEKIRGLRWLSNIVAINGDTGSRLVIEKKKAFARLMLLPTPNGSAMRNIEKTIRLISLIGPFRYLNLDLLRRKKYLEKLIDIERKFRDCELLEAFDVFVESEFSDHAYALHIHDTNRTLFPRSALKFEALITKP